MSQEKEQVPQMDLPEQMRFRRDKLQKLEEAGLSPYRLTSCQVSHHALDIIQS
ncbi:MAG: lysine--tRNA ligase, partial [Clostridiaceae bacterium]|nr:lysine--tRNA ligase [Clostridiaceae bacterium]